MIDKTIEVRLAEIEKDLEYLRKQTDAICAKLDEKYVTQDQLRLVTNDLKLIQRIVYGLCGCVFLSVAYAIIRLVVK